MTIPPGDTLIHAGDISMKGEKDEVADFLEWFDNQDSEHKILIAGNHDFFFKRESNEHIQRASTQKCGLLKRQLDNN